MKHMKKYIRKIRRALYTAIDRDVFIQPSIQVKGERHGSDYGGWVILPDSLKPSSIVISAGLGHDITFDVSIIAKYGCKVVGYDPDPKAYAYHDKDSFPPGFEWRRIGLSDKSEKMKLYKPPREDWVSGTLIQGAILHSDKYDIVEVLDVAVVLASFPAEIDVLKMDIEGAEYAVVEKLLSSGAIKYVRQLLIEYHHGKKYRGSDTKRSVAKILNAGYELFYVSDVGHEFSFLRKHNCP